MRPSMSKNAIVDLATGRIGRSQLTDWLRQHVKPLV
jgi:malate synthase